MKPGERIRQLRKTQGMTLHELALRTESDVGNLSRLERGVQGYSELMLQKIAAALETDVATFFTAPETEIAAEKKSPLLPSNGRSESKIFRIHRLDLPTPAAEINAANDTVALIRALELEPERARLIFGALPADSIRLINLKGDSMAPTLEPADLVFIDISVNAFDGDGIYIFSFNGNLFVKRLQQVKSSLYVLSDNTRYKEWIISEQEIPSLQLLGRVIGAQSQHYRHLG